MRRAAPANWSNLPNRNRPRFYTAWVLVVRKRSERRIDVSRHGEMPIHGLFSGFGGFSDCRRC